MPDKVLVVRGGEIKTPPLSPAGRVRAGTLIRRLQRGEMLSLPESRPMPAIGKRCHELRFKDGDSTWRIIYRIDSDAIVVMEMFKKKTTKTPDSVIRACKARIKEYDS